MAARDISVVYFRPIERPHVHLPSPPFPPPRSPPSFLPDISMRREEVPVPGRAEGTRHPGRFLIKAAISGVSNVLLSHLLLRALRWVRRDSETSPRSSSWPCPHPNPLSPNPTTSCPCTQPPIQREGRRTGTTSGGISQFLLLGFPGVGHQHLPTHTAPVSPDWPWPQVGLDPRSRRCHPGSAHKSQSCPFPLFHCSTSVFQLVQLQLLIHRPSMLIPLFPSLP